MAALSEYTNVYNTALNVLKQKGFRLWRDVDTDMYCAEKNGWDFMADNPCSLLGLIAIHEWKAPAQYTEYWWKDDSERLYGKLDSAAPEFTPVYEKPRG
ncbi:hypothetical protein SAMN05428960_1417 [Mitsuaria sp. PDC51]|uniref:hypothetical protein n=1 Tax=Mitsuaria sp. PDC51 TaxID=1881035 RepID=UPI0008E36FCC|nr:hypothetical protein [Mitsuaria sp. PDC51]SFR77248.1 hypothetical protein SAMN05428960_1417 [Mitsuaria sp. PDC51]